MFSPKTGTDQRYICVPEDDRTWTVWDTQDRKAATLGSKMLNHRLKQRAFAACEILNRIEESKHSRRRQIDDHVLRQWRQKQKSNKFSV